MRNATQIHSMYAHSIQAYTRYSAYMLYHPHSGRSTVLSLSEIWDCWPANDMWGREQNLAREFFWFVSFCFQQPCYERVTLTNPQSFLCGCRIWWFPLSWRIPSDWKGTLHLGEARKGGYSHIINAHKGRAEARGGVCTAYLEEWGVTTTEAGQWGF